MSQWTHVNASIRFDGIKGMTPKPDLGTPLHFDDYLDDDDEAKVEACDIPCGSEGSLHHLLMEVGDGMVRFTASIWGDLRDFGNDRVDEIKDYLARIIVGQMVRSGIAEITVEGEKPFVLQVMSDDGTLENQRWRVVGDSP